MVKRFSEGLGKFWFKKFYCVCRVAISLVVSLSLSLNGVVAEAVGEIVTGSSLVYEISDDGKITLLSVVDKNVENINIPSFITSIGDDAFKDCHNLTGITIAGSVTNIDRKAFSDCENLTNIIIPDLFTKSGKYAVVDNLLYEITGDSAKLLFAPRGIKDIDIPEDLPLPPIKEIEKEACKDCSNLENVKLPSSLVSIGYGAFYGCTSLTSITIPNSVTSIGGGAFSGCSSLTSVTIPNSVTSIGDMAFHGCKSLKNLTIPDSFTTSRRYAAFNNLLYEIIDGNAKLLYVPGGLESVTIGEGLPFPVTSIGEYAFSDYEGLTSFTIPDSVTSIERRAFWGCKNLTSIIIPNSVTSIDPMAFEGCHNLTSITIPGSFTTSGKYAAFNNLLYEITGDSAKLLHVPGGLESVTIGEGLHIPVTSIGDYAFYDFHKLTNVTIPDSVTSIGEYGFFHCPNLTSITIPGSFTTSKRYAASNNLLYEIIDGSAKLLFVPRGLESVTIGEGLPIPVTSIESGTFSGCDKLTSITISDPVTSIGNYVFRGCRGLTSITIPDSVTSIGEGAFWGCENLTSVTIPGSVTIKGNIGENLFCGCRSLTSITIPGSFTTSRRYAASNNLLYEIIDGSAKLLYVPRGLESVTIGEGLPIPVTSIGCYAFCDWNSSKVRGDDAFRVYARSKDGGDDAFRDYNSSNHLTSVTIPNSVTSIDYCAFYNCHNLTSIKIPNSVTSIGSGAFKDCHNLGGIALPNSVTSIGSGAFKDCHNLEGIGLSNSVMHIDPTIFRGCDKLTRIAIPGLFTTSRKYAAFNNLLYEITGDSAKLLHVPAGLKSVFIGEGPFLVTSIGDCAFCGCRGLTSITIPDSVTSIGEEAFWRCESLRSIMIPDSVTSIGTWAFGGCENLTNIIIPGSFTTSGKYAAFNNLLYEIIDGSAKLLFVPKGLESVSIGEGLSFPVTSIGDYAFCSCQNLTNITIPDSVTSIGDCAFYGCGGLTSITIPDSVTSIGDCAFYGCGGLTSITIPASVTSIGDEAFYGCKSLTSATILDRE